MNLTYKRATLEDIDILVKTRIEVLRAANKRNRFIIDRIVRLQLL